jgi:glycosyltransferase involved in cell wall biosynthesis
MRITLVITNLATGGAETMLLKLVQKIDRERFSLKVISLMGLGEVGPKIINLGIPVYAVGMRRGGLPSPKALWRLWQLLRQSKPDVVHTWMYHSDLLGGVAARLIGCRRLIWGIRHSNLSKTENKRSTLWVVKLCAALSRVVPMRVLSCSHRALGEHLAVGYAAAKLHVIPNGFDLGFFAPDARARTSLRTELGLPADAPLVGLVARYDSQKNHVGFVVAAALLNERSPDVHFVLAGQNIDAGNAELVAAIDQKGLRSRMHLLGLRGDVPRLMAALDVLALSSHGESFPNVLGEAMACGVPCVVTDVGDSAEIVGTTGRVVPAGDMVGLANGLFELLELSTDQRTLLGEQARARVAAEYEIGHVAAQYMAFYERVMVECQWHPNNPHPR